MKNPFKKNKHTDLFLDYAALLIMLIMAIVAIRLFDLSNYSLFVTVVMVSIGYVFWGVMHHKKAGHIDKKIVLEYAGLAILVDIIVYMLII